MEDPKILHDMVVQQCPPLGKLLAQVVEGTVDINTVLNSIEVIPGVQENLAPMTWTLVGYRTYGQQVFVVGPRLRELLENTSLAGVPQEKVGWPYPFFYVALPGCQMTISGGETGEHRVAGAHVGLSSAGVVSVFVWGAANERSVSPDDDASLSFAVPLTVSDMEASVCALKAERAQIEVAKTLLRVVVNLCIYLQSVGAEKSAHPTFEKVAAERVALTAEMGRKKNPGKARRVAEKLEKLSKARVTWLGRAVEESPEPAKGPGGTSRVGGWVRGHWSPRLDNTEARERLGIRWIQPYLRGATSVPRHYRISEEA